MRVLQWPTFPSKSLYAVLKSNSITLSHFLPSFLIFKRQKVSSFKGTVSTYQAPENPRKTQVLFGEEAVPTLSQKQ